MAKLMNWHVFEKTLQKRNLHLFTLLDVRRIFGISKIAATFLLYRYAKRDLIRRLKRGLYVFDEVILPDPFLANKLYEPSYVSLEFALSYHRIIPETVYEITSVTTKAPRRFAVREKLFTYRHIRKEAFTGYALDKQRGVSFLMAEPEKAFVDLMYFRMINKGKPISRFKKDKINRAKAVRYAKLFKSRKLLSIIKKSL